MYEVKEVGIRRWVEADGRRARYKQIKNGENIEKLLDGKTNKK